MINFEEELKKFHPSMEIEGVEDAVYNHDMTDMMDIFLTMMKEKADATVQAQVQAQQQAQAQVEHMILQSQYTQEIPPLNI